MIVGFLLWVTTAAYANQSNPPSEPHHLNLAACDKKLKKWDTAMDSLFAGEEMAMPILIDSDRIRIETSLQIFLGTVPFSSEDKLIASERLVKDQAIIPMIEAITHFQNEKRNAENYGLKLSAVVPLLGESVSSTKFAALRDRGTQTLLITYLEEKGRH